MEEKFTVHCLKEQHHKAMEVLMGTYFKVLKEERVIVRGMDCLKLDLLAQVDIETFPEEEQRMIQEIGWTPSSNLVIALGKPYSDCPIFIP